MILFLMFNFVENGMPIEVSDMNCLDLFLERYPQQMTYIFLWLIER